MRWYDGKLLVISEYIGLRAKSYANKLYNVEEKQYEEKKKSKGVSNKHLKKRIDFNDYKECLFDEKVVTLGKLNKFEFINKTQEHYKKYNDCLNEIEYNKYRKPIYSFVSNKLTTYSIESGKIALSGKDDKRILMKDKIHTYALGHYKTNN